MNVTQVHKSIDNPHLQAKVASFLWDPVMWVHPDRLSRLFTIPIDVKHLSPMARRFAYARLGFIPCQHLFPVMDGSRFLLLGNTTLTLLAQWLGALAYAKSLRTLLNGETIRHLTKDLPGVYPEVLHELGWFLPDLSRLQKTVYTETLPTVHQIETAGWRLLYAHLAHLPCALLHRFTLRFPLEMDNLWAEPLPWQHTEADISILQRLLKRISLAEFTLCCS